jgi:hypothetical protein
MARLTISILFTFFAITAWSAETCSRVATINYQEVLVDVSSRNRGEGLRYYIQKDEVAKSLLDEYQMNNKSTWKSAAFSTLGTGMILAGVLRTSGGENETVTNKNFLILGGLTLITVNYFVSRTMEYNNERLLSQSVEEYNKRNTPKIIFAPTDPQNGFGFGVGASQDF